MTRINLVDPATLSNKHLVAECHELPRVLGLVRKAIARGESPDDTRNPSKYVLGKGHVRFFYKRIEFLVKRYAELVVEMRKRKFKVSWPEQDASDIPDEWKNDYIPTAEAIELNKHRIAERSKEAKQ